MSPGMKTSEFAITLSTALLLALNKKLGLELGTQDILAIAGLAVSYIGSRWHQKVVAAKADAA